MTELEFLVKGHLHVAKQYTTSCSCRTITTQWMLTNGTSPLISILRCYPGWKVEFEDTEQTRVLIQEAKGKKGLCHPIPLVSPFAFSLLVLITFRWHLAHAGGATTCLCLGGRRNERQMVSDHDLGTGCACARVALWRCGTGNLHFGEIHSFGPYLIVQSQYVLVNKWALQTGCGKQWEKKHKKGRFNYSVARGKM